MYWAMAWVPYPLLSALPMALALWRFEHDIHGMAYMSLFMLFCDLETC